MSKYTKKDIIRLVEEEDVEFIRLQFTDMFGTMKNVNNMAHIKALFGKYNTGHPLHNGL